MLLLLFHYFVHEYSTKYPPQIAKNKVLYIAQGGGCAKEMRKELLVPLLFEKEKVFLLWYSETSGKQYALCLKVNVYFNL